MGYPQHPDHTFDDVKIEIMCAESNLCGCHTMKPVIDQATRAELTYMRDHEPLFFAIHYESNFNDWFLMAIYKTPMYDRGADANRNRARYHIYHPFVRLDRQHHSTPYFNLAREVIKARTGNLCPHRIHPHMTLDTDGTEWEDNQEGWVCILESSCNFGDECTESDYKYCYLQPKQEE
jgi:hypothetical protein